MKRLILFIALYTFAPILGFGQVTVDGVNINKLSITYCQLEAARKVSLKSYTVTIDYGQSHVPLKPQKIAGPDGELMDFNSMVDALNFMDDNGWELISTHSNTPVHYYLLKREE